MACSLPLFPQLGRDFFPQVDAGQMRLHVRAPPATRIEETQRYFAEVEHAIRKIVGDDQIDVILDNIGLPYSGINIALSDSATVGPMDGEILISLKKEHSPTAAHVAALRHELPRRFPELQFFFQPADIVNQVLNFGQPAPIDVRISGPDERRRLSRSPRRSHMTFERHSRRRRCPCVPGSRRAGPDHQCRSHARRSGWASSEDEVAKNVLVTANSSAQTVPEFLDRSEEQRELSAGCPDADLSRQFDSGPRRHAGELRRGKSSQILMNVATFGRKNVPLVASQFNIRPVFDVNADVQGRDLASAADAIDKVLAKERAASTTPVDDHAQRAGRNDARKL